MGYRIVYDSQEGSVPKRKSSSRRLRTLIAAAFFLFSITVRLTWQEGTEIMREYLLPGDLNVTEQAFIEMVSDLRQGEPVGDSLTVFCRTILNEAS